jgi:hypothetical protein
LTSSAATQADPRKDPNAGIEAFYGSPHGTLKLDGTEPILGDSSARYLVVPCA